MLSFKEEIEVFFCLLAAVENLQNLLFSSIRDPNPLKDENKMQGGQLRRAETFGVTDGNPAASAMKGKLT